jgi:NADPH:quinone reductase-like Zn-dependent oxidoreductase
VAGVCSTSKADLVRSLGAENVIDYTHDEIDCDGARYDAVIDTAGNRPRSLLRRAMNPHGTLVLVVVSTVAAECSAASTDSSGHRWSRSSSGSGCAACSPRSAKERADDLEAITRLVESGAATPVIDRTSPLVDTPDAIRNLAEGRAAGKVVVTI